MFGVRRKERAEPWFGRSGSWRKTGSFLQTLTKREKNIKKINKKIKNKKKKKINNKKNEEKMKKNKKKKYKK